MQIHAFANTFASDRVDREAGVIRGVSVVTAGLANGGIMDETSLRQIIECAQQYENGLKVVDRHTKGTDSIFSTTGTLKNFRFASVGGVMKVLADLHLLKSESNGTKLMEMAETMPDTFGLSVAFSGVDENIAGETHWRCAEIYNAALVDVPAANPTGLFSRAGTEAQLVPVHFVDARKVDMATTTSDSGATKKEFEDNITGRVKKLEDMITAFEAKFAALPTAKEPDGDEAACMADAVKQVKELSASIETRLKEFSANRATENAELVRTVAKEFAATVGNSAQLKTDGAGTGGNTRIENAPAAGGNGTAKAFAALVVKKFGETKSKVSAIRAAMTEDPKGYEAFRTSGLDIKYS